MGRAEASTCAGGLQVALEYCSQLSAAGSEGRQVLGLISVLGTSQPPLTALFGRRTGIMRSAISGLPRAIARAAAALIVSLPRVSYWVMVHAGLGEAGVDYPTALSWAQHIAALDVESVRAFLLAAESHRCACLPPPCPCAMVHMARETGGAYADEYPGSTWRANLEP
mmetsp:Transcript_13246/g.34041  ORF Transcript_13246/g.34041 Transcript_13246/m.34041 type:complete len:168 (+) Transcript_13246:532-1035(+)